MTFPIVDSHCHLDFDVLQADLPGVLSRAANAGVHLMVTICTEVNNFPVILKIASENDNVYCSVGTHPNHAADEPVVPAGKLIELAQHPRVIAIGEAGLDFHYDRAPADLQEVVFRNHIKAARQTGLPLVIHSRQAEDETLRILDDEMGKGAFKPLFHCFSSKSYLAEKALELGAYVSFSGILTFNSAVEIRKAAEMVPLDRLLVETDAPFLAPVPHRGKP
ncbi:MAG TPA: TatD family deoxyribonuclease, partial [Rhizobiales bacterium]|nr:TatD family deoxyribonuclease [Hyphomicrobiales bacterium]